MSLKSTVVSCKNSMEQISNDIKNIITELKDGRWEGPAFNSISAEFDSINTKISNINNHFEIYSAVAELVEALEVIIQRLDKLKSYKGTLTEANTELDSEINRLENEKNNKILIAKRLLNGINDTSVSTESLTNASLVIKIDVVSSAKKSVENSNSVVKLEPTSIDDIDLGSGKYMTDEDWVNSPYITKEEFRCQCGGKYCDGYPVKISKALVEDLNKIRFYYGKPVIINSGIRCKQHNKNVGGASNSNHTKGRAVDIVIEDVSAKELLAYIKSNYKEHNSDSYTGSQSGYAGMDGVVHFGVKEVELK